MAKVVVGEFSIDAAGEVTGPAEYMEDPKGFAEIKAKVEAGESAVYAFGCVGRSAEHALLVAVQTHYAGWKGMREFKARNEAARESQLRYVEEVRARKAREAAERKAARKTKGKA